MKWMGGWDQISAKLLGLQGICDNTLVGAYVIWVGTENWFFAIERYCDFSSVLSD